MQNIAYLLGFSSLSIYHCRPVWLRFWHVKTICKNIINRFLRLFGKMTNVCSVGMASYVWWTRTATIWIITDPRCGFGVHAMWPNLSYYEYPMVFTVTYRTDHRRWRQTWNERNVAYFCMPNTCMQISECAAFRCRFFFFFFIPSKDNFYFDIWWQLKATSLCVASSTAYVSAFFRLFCPWILKYWQFIFIMRAKVVVVGIFKSFCWYYAGGTQHMLSGSGYVFCGFGIRPLCCLLTHFYRIREQFVCGR